jgi:transcriptional regulator with XRE-family HTH domain
MRTNVSTAMRALRQRRGWRQDDLGARAGLTRDIVSRVERARLGGVTLWSLERLSAALDAQLVVELRWQGALIERLVDRRHAALQETTARRLAAAGWLTQAEVTFNYYGDRGSCDLVAWHPASRIMLIVEVKSALGNVQETLHRLDTKVRLGSVIAGQLGWPAPIAVGGALVIAKTRAARQVVGTHASIFAAYSVRGWAARRWLASPGGAAGCCGSRQCRIPIAAALRSGMGSGGGPAAG